jgi:predicted Zn-dependent protease
MTIVLAPALLLGACQKNLATGRSQFIMGMTPQQEIQLGTEAAPQLTKEFGGKVRDQQLQQYVTDVGRAMTVHTEGDAPNLPWEFTLLDSGIINAFALPGGKVFISRGLAKQMTSEAQLAGVLGHEIGHVTARHSAERISQVTAIQVGTAIAGTILATATEDDSGRYAGIALAVGGQLVALKFSRDQELESDALGLRYMTRAGYNPRGLMEVMQILARASGGQGGGIEAFLATHPDPQVRADIIAQKLNGEYRPMLGNPKYQSFEDRFRQRMTSRLALLPSPKHAPEAYARLASEGGVVQVLGQPSSWCAHCAAEEAALASSATHQLFAGF